MILTNNVNYVQYNRNPKDFYYLDVKAIDQKNHRKIYDRLKEEDREVLELAFGNNPENYENILICMRELNQRCKVPLTLMKIQIGYNIFR